MKRVKRRNRIYRKNHSMLWNSIVLFIIWMLFFLNRDFVINCDLRLHYEFALQLPTVLKIGLKEFEQKVKYAHILSYPGWHIFFLLVYKSFSVLSGRFGLTVNTENLSILSQAVVNSVLLLLTFWIIFYVNKIFYKMEKKWAQIFAVGIMFVGPIYLPLVHKTYYIGQFTANPWHNPTSFAVRPIAVATFFLYCWIWNQHNDVIKRINRRKENLLLLVFSLSLLISGYLKPSFYQIFVPALFAFCVIDVLRTKFKSFVFCMKTAMAVLPVCVMALLQYLTSFITVGNKVILSPFKVWSYFTPNIVGSFVISMAFPIASYLFCRYSEKRTQHDSTFLLSILLFGSAVSQFVLFSFEEGWTAGDFVWGVYLATLIVFIVESNNVKKFIQKEGMNIKSALVAFLLSLHVLCGVGYFCACYILDAFYI